MERGIDAMKYRKSSHLAGVDVEVIIAEKGKCVLTIKDAYFDKGVEVNGKKLDGYFLTFLEDVKPMVVNSTNRKTIAANLKILKNCESTVARNIGNWIGMTIELYFDESVVMKGERTGGMRIKPQNPIKDIDPKPAIAKLKLSTTLTELKTNWDALSDDEKKLAAVVAEKESLKTKLK